MSARSKLCAVIIDEMSVKECLCHNAANDKLEAVEDYGCLGKTTFLVRGLVTKWKQPIGYFFQVAL